MCLLTGGKVKPTFKTTRPNLTQTKLKLKNQYQNYKKCFTTRKNNQNQVMIVKPQKWPK